MLSERKEYPLRSIYFYPTESCNLRCIHCWIHPAFAPNDKIYESQNNANVSLDVLEKTIREALPLGLSHIKFTGGEPFLNPDLFTYLDCFSRFGLTFSFETNGTLLTKDTVKRLKRYHLTKISVSLDGSKPEVHDNIRGIKGSFEKAVRGIRLLIDHGFSPQVIFCLQRLNAKDLENTIEFLWQLNVRSFEINPVTLLDGNDTRVAGCEALAVEELLMLEKRIEEEFRKRFQNIYIDLFLPPALKGIKELSRAALCTCHILNICGILSNGDVSICGIGRVNKRLIVGNIKETGIASLWNEGAIFREIRSKIPFQFKGVCGNCIFKYHCLGFCRADVLAKEHALINPYWVCEEVHRKGLFPVTRLLS
ncbi:MAG: radical SAM protein [bacterium]